MNVKKGLDWFPLDTRLDDKFELIEAEFGAAGFAVVIKLLQRIYDLNGYYCDWTKPVALLFGRNCGVGANVVEEIVRASLRLGLFDRDMFDRYGVLTSRGIQKRYLNAVTRRKEPQLREELRLVPLPKKSQNVDILRQNVNILPQSRGEQSRVEQSRGEESREEQSTPASAGGSPSVPFPSEKNAPIDLEGMTERYRKSLQKIGSTPKDVEP